MTTPERSVNPDTCCLDCKRYGTTPSKFPIYCSNNDCKCHKTPTPEKSIEGIEEIKERFRNKILDVETAVRLTYNEKDSDQMIKKMLDFNHQELQKAREEERERIIYITKNIKDAFMSPLTERRWLQCIQFKDQPKPKDQSELDQPIS